MTLKIVVSGEDPESSAPEAADLLREIGEFEPEQAATSAEGSKRLDPATAIALASLALSIPGAALAALQIKDRFDRKRVAKLVEDLKAKLEETGNEAILEASSGAPVDLRRAGTDAIVDKLLAALKHQGA